MSDNERPREFRPRRMTGEERRARIAALIASGEVADPAIGPEPPRSYPPETVVVDVPTARVDAVLTEE